LENLVSILETGEDLRIIHRPMMGITISEFNDEVARKLGVPVNQGVRLDDVLDGMGAKAAGLITDDVIVAIADKKIKDWASLADALQLQQSGDQVEVGFYCGSDKMTTTMVLSSRPMPEIPTSQKGLAEIVSEKFREIESQLEELFAHVTESEASYKPGPEDWSGKKNLAHLIHGERFTQNLIYQLLGSQEQVADD
jgi:predicted metalloprotease with PDZ domain